MRIATKQVCDKWMLYTLVNDHGMEVSLLNYGGIITRIITPDKDGNRENIVLSYDNLAEYVENPNYFGALIGRIAGRTANAVFTLDGVQYRLDTNEGNHHLHGGAHSFSKVVWDVETFITDNMACVKLIHEASDGEGGYPGNLRTVVTYSLSNANELEIDYQAQSDQNTVLTLTNHSYFNLRGKLDTTVHNHHVFIASDETLELDNELIPTGKRLAVTNTPFDFRNGRWLRDGFSSDHLQNRIVGGGYDHYFIFQENKKEQVKVTEPVSGRTMTITTDQPGMVMYTANGLQTGLKLAGGLSKKHLGVCFETQGSPASLQHNDLSSIRLEAGELYHKKTVFQIGVES
ncbi:aldose epimerase family protein [Virgibacillus sp. LDC-1]|uniref:aldose epimerase family protein n=1 Tax=Virgibacillus sp. LDC-1 TaxID=3039856 RepID=UPI0024DE837C|nr:aldose epimerase family protein [Virgibacillus sp. LDC-1]